MLGSGYNCSFSSLHFPSLCSTLTSFTPPASSVFSVCLLCAVDRLFPCSAGLLLSECHHRLHPHISTGMGNRAGQSHCTFNIYCMNSPQYTLSFILLRSLAYSKSQVTCKWFLVPWLWAQGSNIWAFLQVWVTEWKYYVSHLNATLTLFIGQITL